MSDAGWQPIGTVEKTGRPLWLGGAGRKTMAYWVPDPGAHWANWYTGHRVSFVPTCWMPVPADPE